MNQLTPGVTETNVLQEYYTQSHRKIEFTEVEEGGGNNYPNEERTR